jgi:hypothetical protein
MLMSVQERIIVKGRLKLLKFMRTVGMEKTAVKMRVKIRAFFRMLLLKSFFVKKVFLMIHLSFL